MGNLRIRVAMIALLFIAMPVVAAPPTLTDRVVAKLAEQGPGTRFGLLVVTEDGREVVSIAADHRFVPASNTKLFTTAAALATLPAIDQPDEAGGTGVALAPGGHGLSDVILIGRGDARMSSRPDCTVDCLATLADAVAARTKKVRDIIGDATAFLDERWSAGMSWNNIPSDSGTATAALSLDDNEVPLTVKPGAEVAPPLVEVTPYYTIDNRAVTVASGSTTIGYDRLPFARELQVTGNIAVSAVPATDRLGIDDPAHFAAWTFQKMLEARGVKVKGSAKSRYGMPVSPVDAVGQKLNAAADRAAVPSTELAHLTPAPLAADLTIINKVSQNLHAELLLRRIGKVTGTGSVADGQKAIQAMLDRAGVPRWSYDLADGSGMSSYNRVAPRGMVTFLRWTTTQPWGAAFRATLPIGGVDGTLRRRFTATPLTGRIFAKTGTLDKANALAGFMVAASGRTLTFAAYAADMPQSGSATRGLDAALELVAAAN